MPRSKYSLKQPAMTTYSYNGLYGLNAERLFMWIVIDTTKEQLGIDDIVGAIAIISGQPVISTRGKPSGATKGTSVASLASRRAIDVQLPFRLPMFAGKSLFTLRIAMTRHLGAWVGRTIPFVGYVIMAKDVTEIILKSVRRYNALVKPEDKMAW
ncbi:STM2901 family protein [Acetobacter sp.]|uniref:STM2901 family protein n=2 Tax=Acetobacter sp. TaxID=440 RepID=UPI0039EC66BF